MFTFLTISLYWLSADHFQRVAYLEMQPQMKYRASDSIWTFF